MTDNERQLTLEREVILLREIGRVIVTKIGDVRHAKKEVISACGWGKSLLLKCMSDAPLFDVGFYKRRLDFAKSNDSRKHVLFCEGRNGRFYAKWVYKITHAAKFLEVDPWSWFDQLGLTPYVKSERSATTSLPTPAVVSAKIEGEQCVTPDDLDMLKDVMSAMKVRGLSWALLQKIWEESKSTAGN